MRISRRTLSRRTLSRRTLYLSLYLATATVSSVHAVDLFATAHPGPMSWASAAVMELAGMACVASVASGRAGWVQWSLLLTVSLTQVLANLYSGFAGPGDDTLLRSLLGTSEMGPDVAGRISAAVSGAVFPLVALGFAMLAIGERPTEESRTEETPDGRPSEDGSDISTEGAPQRRFDLTRGWL